MLKIKADRMKDLEKFRFVKNEIIDCYTYDFGFCDTLFIRCDTCDLFLSNECSSIPNIVYDLIKADMVEKVVEDEQD